MGLEFGVGSVGKGQKPEVKSQRVVKPPRVFGAGSRFELPPQADMNPVKRKNSAEAEFFRSEEQT